MRTFVLCIAAVAGVIYAILPPLPRTIIEASGTPAVRGAIHIHTRRSDGTGTVDDVARAAARAGLSFVVITDHGDGTREPDPPSYRDGVLCIDAVEISTDDGHLVAIGLPKTPYPFSGEARDVVEDAHRLGGWVVAAHPGSSKDDLAWRDWEVPLDGIEWVNGDSEWRDESVFALARVLLTYPFRAREALATLLDRPDPVLGRWNQLAARRPIVGLAAVDAHARVGLTSIGEPYDARVSVPLPSYRSVFAALSVVLDDVVLTGDAAADAARVEQALRSGQVHSSVDAFAAGGGLRFTATSGEVTVVEGQTLVPTGSVTLRAVAGVPAGARLSLLRDGRAIDDADGGRLEAVVAPDPAVYRVEVTLAGTTGQPPIPWLLSNPVYVRAAVPPAEVAPASRRWTMTPYTSEMLGAVRIEHSANAEGAASVTRTLDARELLFRYALGGRPGDSPYVAAVLPLAGPLTSGGAMRFTARADGPMRVSVQLRSPAGTLGERWRRSVYLDDTFREVTIPLESMKPVGGPALEDRLGGVDALLLVVDDVNTPLGRGGRVWIRNLEIGE